MPPASHCAALVIGLISFTALTLAGGGPCYEHIAEKVDDDPGGAPTEAENVMVAAVGLGASRRFAAGTTVV